MISFHLVREIILSSSESLKYFCFSVLFFRNSLLITVFMLLQSLIVKTMSTNEASAPQWAKSLIIFVRDKHMDFILFSSNGSDKAPDDQHDENILIAEKSTNSADNKIWRNLCSALDRISIVILLIAYIIMSFTLIPFQYAAIADPIETVTDS